MTREVRTAMRGRADDGLIGVRVEWSRRGRGRQWGGRDLPLLLLYTIDPALTDLTHALHPLHPRPLVNHAHHRDSRRQRSQNGRVGRRERRVGGEVVVFQPHAHSVLTNELPHHPPLHPPPTPTPTQVSETGVCVCVVQVLTRTH